MSKPMRLALHLTLIYAVFGILWISLSDNFVATFATDPADLIRFQAYKGWFYVLVTAMLVYFLVKRTLDHQSTIEDELRESEELWHFALESSGDGVLDWNPQTDELHHSKRCEEILGYSESGFPNSWAAWIEQQHPDDKNHDLSSAKEYFLTAHTPFESECRMRCKDGSWKWLWLHGMVVGRSDDGNPLRVIGTLSDINERKQVEANIRLERDRNQHYLDTVQTLMVALDVDGKITMINRAGLDMLGYEEHELLGCDWFATCLPQTQAKDSVYSAFYMAMSGELEAVAYLENEVLCRDGHRLMIAWHNNYLTDDTGRLIGVLSSGQDITQIKHNQQVLLNSEKTYRSLFENMLNGFAYCQMQYENGIPKDFVYINVNRAFLTLTGLKNVEGKKVSDVIPNIRESDPGLIETYSRVATSGVPEKFETFVVALQMWFSISVYSPKQDYFVAVFDVITERKLAEEQLQLAATVYQSLGEAVMVADADNNILAVNPAFTTLTGYSFDEAVGRKTNMLYSGRHDKNFYQAMWHSLNTTGKWEGEVCNRRKNGEEYFGWLMISTVYDSHGTVQRRVGLSSDITERKQAVELSRYQANFDILTELPNRRLFHDRLQQEIKKAKRDGKKLALMFLDLDMFKDINDTLGHAMGDVLLKEFAKRLAQYEREADTVARMGGDEFTIIMGELDDISSVERVAQGVLQGMAEPFRLGNELCYISVSIGITIYPDDATDDEDLQKKADQAMYAAKHQGRNRICYFTSSMQEAAQTKLELTNALRGALAGNQLWVAYQPIVELATGVIHKAEALLRWQHPERGLISPTEFIPLAEETGLINSIGDWVFHQAVQQSYKWRADLHPNFQISVNKSPAQFRVAANLHATWLAHLQEYGLDGQSIVVEITEGLLMDAGSNITDQLLAFRDAGIQVSLDDFGTGYSSLSYLKRFDIDYLKIDQSFVKNLAPDSDDMALCEAIIVMAHKLNIRVIAEGVETAEQRDLLTVAGCDYGQGYLWSKPVPPDEFERLLTKP